MKNIQPFTPKTKLKVIQLNPESKVQQVTWPSVDTGDHSRPVALPPQPRAEILNQADGRSLIIVTCTCGKRIEIVCET